MNKQQKKHEKISMSSDTLNNVMLISVNGPDIAEFDAARAVDNLISSGQRRLKSGHNNKKGKTFLMKCNYYDTKKKSYKPVIS